MDAKYSAVSRYKRISSSESRAVPRHCHRFSNIGQHGSDHACLHHGCFINQFSARETLGLDFSKLELENGEKLTSGGTGCGWSICRDAPRCSLSWHRIPRPQATLDECATTRLNFIVVVVVVMADNVPQAPATLPAAFKRRRPKPLGDSRLTLAGRERRPMDPIPKPLAEKVKLWKFDKPRARHGITYPLERKMEVLVFLVKKRFADPYTKRKRARVGQQLDDDAVHATAPDGREFLVRPPTYQEAAEWWHIPLGTIQKWWDNRDKILEGSGIVL